MIESDYKIDEYLMDEIIEFIDYNVFGFFTDRLEERVTEMLDGYFNNGEITEFEYDYLEEYFLQIINAEDEDEE